MKLKGSLKDENVLLITPLIDIMFLILIFFVLNSSFTENNSVEVDVPKAISGSSLGQSELNIILTRDHKIYINESETTLNSFSVDFLANLGTTQDPVVIIQGDKSISYDFLMGIMDRVKVLGFNNIALVVNNKNE